MELIGTVARLQVQRSSMKRGERSASRYVPLPLTMVPRLTLTRDGVIGHAPAEDQIIDVHNRQHPHSKNRAGSNGISLGFTSHYGAMRQRFGSHLVDGIAGENLLIETTRMVSPDDIRRGLLFESSDGQFVPFLDGIVAAPCVEFTRYALQFPDERRPDETVKEALQFLHNGMRGYYVSIDLEATEIGLGARVYVA